MKRKKTDPVLVALLDQQALALLNYERWYSKTKRAFNHLDKIKRQLVRLARKIDGYGDNSKATTIA